MSDVRQESGLGPGVQPAAPPAGVAAAGRERAWYVVHTYSGYENKVKTNLEKRIQTMEMEDRIFRVLVPVRDEVEIKEGKRKDVKRKVFPGYVLVEMIMTDESWYVVRNTPGVTGFVSSGNKPVALQPEEAEQILREAEAGQEPTTRVWLELGQSVRVTAGPFAGFIGTVDQIDVGKKKIVVKVSVFGRETPMDLEFNQVEAL